MRRLENQPRQPAVREFAPAGVAPAQPWIEDSRFQALMSLLFYALMLYMAVPATVLHPRVGNEILEPNLFYRVLKLILLGSGIVIVLWRHALAVRLLAKTNWCFLIWLVLIASSTAWSIEPGITITRCLAVATICLACLSCVMVGWYDRRFQELVRSMFTALMVGSLIFGVISPQLAMEQGTGISLEGAWRGLMGQKNGLGHAASITVFFWMHGWLSKEVKFLRFAFGFGAGAVCLLLSRSSTSLFSASFSIILLLLLLRGPKRKRRYMSFLVALFVAVILLYSLAALNIIPGLDFLLQPIIGATGKDMTFSGRTQIWAVIRDHISEQPLLGTGFGAYWIGPVPTSPSYVFINRQSNFYPTEAHNGYLDITNDLGYVGLLVLLGYLIVFLRQTLTLLKVDFTQATLFLALLFEELINNLTESDWLSSTAFSFVVMTLATFALARARLGHAWALQQQAAMPAAAPPPAAPPVARRIRSRQFQRR